VIGQNLSSGIYEASEVRHLDMGHTVTSLPTMVSDRLRLEPLRVEHAEIFFESLQNPLIYEFIDEAPPECAEALRLRYKRLESRTSPDGSELWLNWAVYDQRQGRYAGYVQATVDRDQTATLAYVIFPDYWGLGLGREAVSLVREALLGTYGVRRLRARVDRRNLRSLALIRGLGFVELGPASDTEADVILGFDTDPG
jgi:[ribosomal protein S5]-alanine N-acetyltransferase